MASNSTWSADGLSQMDLMVKDQCLVLNHDDEIIGNASKYDIHVFSPETPRGKVHRAFSVFLFNSEGKLLLQKRAADKITFPNAWTNTCCSHPLFGYTPTEVDTAADLASGNVPGVKAAAVRKLLHELGIESAQLPVEKFKFLTRLHYWAADVVTHGPQSPWGEHEIDYILFIKTDVDVKPNPEEVGDFCYVSLPELQAMMAQPDLLWTPWFRIIAERFLIHWMKDLDTTLTTDKFVDVKTIHRFDPTSEHMGGAGNAGPWLDLINTTSNKTSPSTPTTIADPTKKQGAYGKVVTHSESTLKQLQYPAEIVAGLWLKVFGMKTQLKCDDEAARFSDDMLGKVSRSFAMVIRHLPEGLAMDVLIFYLVLRALDTVEDDMEAFSDNQVKIKHLQEFFKTSLTPGWTMQGVGRGDEATLLEQFHLVIAVYKRLSPKSQEVIADITRRMGAGMAEFVEKDLGQGTVNTAQYNQYCHYVAGLVGHGLSRLFSATGYEAPEVAESLDIANSMGLFLQKTNIIRDYLEDYVDGRAFWPQDVWRQYTKTGKLGELAEPESRDRAVQCLNHLVSDALELVPECMEYLEQLTTPEVFSFCAIPQVMAIATLDKVYNNPQVFTGVVKIRRGLSARLIFASTSTVGVHLWFNKFARNVKHRTPVNDPNAERTYKACDRIIDITEAQATRGRRSQRLFRGSFIAAGALAVTGKALVKRIADRDFTLNTSSTTEAVTLGVAAASAVYLGTYLLGRLVLPSFKSQQFARKK